MALVEISRGNPITFTATFLDANGDLVVPNIATLYLSYQSPAIRTLTSVIMTMQGTDGPWTAQWDSSVASAGIVYWSVRSDIPGSSEDGDFLLDANAANP